MGLEGEVLPCFTAGRPKPLVSFPDTNVCTGRKKSACHERFPGHMTWKMSSFKSLWFLVCSVLLQLLNFSVLHRRFITRAVGVFQWGAEVETDDPAGTGPHVLFRPVPGLLVLLASPTLHPSRHPPEPGGSAPGDGTPPAVTWRIEDWAQRTPKGTIPNPNKPKNPHLWTKRQSGRNKGETGIRFFSCLS